MALELQPFNTSLLANLAIPNGIDIMGKMSQMDLNNAQRERMLAELAYLPQQRANEAMKNKVYALQQGYIMNPDGSFTMTPAKQAQMDFQTRINNALMQAGGIPGGQSQQMMSQAMPQAPQADMGMQPDTSQDQGAPVVDFNQAASDNGDLLGATDEQMAGSPAQQPKFMQTLQQPQAVAPQTGNNKQLLNILSLAGGASGNSPLVSAANNMMQNDINQQKINQGTPEYKSQVKAAEESAKQGTDIDYATYKTALDSAVQNRKMEGQFNQIEGLFKAGLHTGKFEKAALPIKQYLVNAGMITGKPAEQVSDQEAMNAVGNNMAMVMRNPASGGGLTGSTSDRDVEFLLGSVAELGKTDLGNKIIIDMGKAQFKHQRDLVSYMNSLKNGRELPQDFQQKIQAWTDKHPIFTADEAANIVEKAKTLGIHPPEEAAQTGNIPFTADEIRAELARRKAGK